MTQLIGLGGFKESGKDQVAGYLERTRGWASVGMSDRLAAVCSILNPPVPDPHLNGKFAHLFAPSEHWVNWNDYLDRVGGYDNAKTHPFVRAFLQRMGTDVGRKMIAETLWIDATEQTIVPLLITGQSVAVTGIRFQNEADMIARNGGVSYWVERPAIRAQREAEINSALADPTLMHDSEVTLTRTDFALELLNRIEGDLEGGLFHEVDIVIPVPVS